MTKHDNYGWVSMICRIALAGIFIASAAPKVWNPGGFAAAVSAYKMLPNMIVNPLAVYLPWLELLAAVLLLFARSMRDAAILILTGLLLIYTVAVVVALARGLDIDCGCLPAWSQTRVGWWAILRNVMLFAVGIWLYSLDFRRADPAIPPSL